MSISNFKRLSAFKFEMEAWLSGTLFFGRGLSFFALMPGEFVAWGHLGHITILSQLGIVGLVVYSYYLPLAIIKLSKKLWKHAANEVKFLALLAGITMIWHWICFIMSSSFLGQYPVAGIMFGAVWRQAMLIKTDKVLIKQRSHLWGPANKFLRGIVQK
jgi:hypothetical protein